MRGSGSSPPAQITRVASIPSITGIRTSISTTSGRCSTLSRTASAPSAAAPTTVMSFCVSSSAENPARTISWSSATTARITRSSPSSAA